MPVEMKLIFASNNAHKLSEVRRILSPLQVFSLREIGFEDEIAETGTTLEDNSLIKAQAIAEWIKTNCPEDWRNVLIFADDTGLEIEALNGAPGVYTARWAGEPACDANNRKKALVELAGKSNRSARFRTVVTLISAYGIRQVAGEIKGKMATEEKGNHGFGYDALFIPEGYDNTFAELPAEIKNSISHRARAMEKLKQLITTEYK
jgi:XTP/dITP diphosphohydrolase